MIRLKNLCLSYGTQTIFDHVSLVIRPQDRIGLVGRNGAGKSTMLRILAGHEEPDSGIVDISHGMKIAYMPQQVVLDSDRSILNEALCAIPGLKRLVDKKHELDVILAADPENVEATLEYATLQHELDEMHFGPLRAEAQTILHGLGYIDDDFSAPVNSLSVGWKMKLVLAKLLLQKADIYFFDEPTNHLDMFVQEWFASFLKRAPFGFVLVSHERYFLDLLCEEIVELERGKATRYQGNYTKYVSEKEKRAEDLRAAYNQQQREIKEKLALANRFRAKASKAKLAQKLLREVAAIERIDMPVSMKVVNFSFPPIPRAGRIVLSGKGISKSFDEKRIFSDVAFEVERNQKVALVAPNGTGKSTLFNIIAGKLPPDTGEIEAGQNVKTAYFAQEQNKVLDPEKTVLEEAMKSAHKKPESLVRSFLGNFLFSGDDVNKKTKVLSGGEKNRLSMVKVLLQDANLLLLDEPTNHLDIQSKEVLLKALKAYEGTIIFVSHDHDFINRLATHILELSKSGIHAFPGTYEQFLYAKKMMNDEGDSSNKPGKSGSPKRKGSGKRIYELSKLSKKLEAKIDKYSKEVVKFQENLDGLSFDDPSFAKLQSEMIAKQTKVNGFMKEWEAAENEKAALES